LKRTFRRSPHPEEIQQEMMRDKGHGGYCRSQRKNNDIMHGSEAAVEVFVEGERVSATSGTSGNDAVAKDEDSGH